MKIKEILDSTKHRNWPKPNDNWQYYQEWNNAIFLHWQCNLEDLKELVPKELEIDLFKGKPWVSLVGFTMKNIRPRLLPSFPPLSNFHEINIRTYVNKDNKPGVYFISIEGGKILSCKIAKTLSKLPYRYSKIHRDNSKFHSQNSEHGDFLNLEYKTGSILQVKDSLDKWLTERYALYQESKKKINAFEIHHLEWPLQNIEMLKTDYSYARFQNLLNKKPDRVHFSKGVQVLAWNKTTSNRIV